MSLEIAGARHAVGPGYSTVLPSADFETYSEAGYRWVTGPKGGQRLASLPGIAEQSRGLSVVGVRNYVKHPTFRIMCLAYNLKNDTGPQLWIPSDRMYPGDPTHPWDLLQYIVEGGIIEGWNSGGFEFEVWNQYCVPIWGWPVLKIKQVRDAMAKGRAWSMPGSLGDAGKVLKLTHQKNADGQRLLKKFSMPRNPTKADPRTRIRPESDSEGIKLYGYCLTDIASEDEASHRIPDLSEFEQRVYETDHAINQRGMRVDLAAVEDCIAVYEQCAEIYNAELLRIAGCRASEVAKLSGWLRGRGFGFFSLDAEAIEAALAAPDRYPTDVYRALEIRYTLAASSVKKLYAFRAQAAADSRMRGLYGYYATKTGRWNGYGPQPMNLVKGSADMEVVESILEAMKARSVELIEYQFGHAMGPVDAIANVMRSLICAEPGHELICSDYSAIEGVVTAALAGEEWRLEIFRTHGMIYEASAAAITGTPFQEFVDYKKQHGKHHPLRAKIGKFAELACGFGGWIGAMRGFGADEFLSEDEMKTAILAWRAASPNVVEFWGGQTRGRKFVDPRPELYGLEGAAISAVLHPGQAFAYKQIVYQMIGDVLYCQVPSGGFLTYHAPRLEQSVRDYCEPWELALSYEGWNTNPKAGALGWHRMYLYGGKLCENVVQKTARDIQAGALVRLEAANYRPVMHTHDEAVGEVPAGWGTLEEFEALMNAHEAWVVDCHGRPMPIRAKGGWRGVRFRKE